MTHSTIILIYLVLGFLISQNCIHEVWGKKKKKKRLGGKKLSKMWQNQNKKMHVRSLQVSKLLNLDCLWLIRPNC